jgi:hypothetical protein
MNVVALAGPEHGLAAQALTGSGISPEAVRQPSYLRTNFQRGVKRVPVAWTA